MVYLQMVLPAKAHMPLFMILFSLHVVPSLSLYINLLETFVDIGN